MTSYINVIFDSDKTGQAFKTFPTTKGITSWPSSRLQGLHNKIQSSLVRSRLLTLFISIESSLSFFLSSSHQIMEKDRKRAMKGQEDECLEKKRRRGCEFDNNSRHFECIKDTFDGDYDKLFFDR